jgi:uncharacterized protein (TIGR00369 family)
MASVLEAPMAKTALDDFTMPPCAALLGTRLLDARPEEGWLRMGFDARAEFCNPAGFIQGGLLTAMLDDTMGPAVLVATEGALYGTTIDLHVMFLEPARVGPLFGEANVLKLGKTVGYVEGRLMDEKGLLIARGTASVRLMATGKLGRIAAARPGAERGDE